MTDIRVEHIIAWDINGGVGCADVVGKGQTRGNLVGSAVNLGTQESRKQFQVILAVTSVVVVSFDIGRKGDIGECLLAGIEADLA